MNQGIFVSLIYNAALLLALGIIFDSITLRSYRNSLIAKILTGLCLGGIALAIMLNPWVLRPGVVFDTRSILLSLTAMFFGIIPTAIAALMAFAFRLWQGGAGVYMGCSVIIASVMWGYIWKWLHYKWNKPYNSIELYLLGIVNHITMLALTLLLPSGIRLTVFSAIALPIIVIYPVGTVILGQILARRLQRRNEKFELIESEKQFRNLYENAPLPYQSIDAQSNFISVNQAWLQTLGYLKEEVIGRNIADFLHQDFKELFVQSFPKFKAAGSVDGFEFVLIRKDGLPILVSMNGKVIYLENGSFQQMHCVFNNITEQRKQESSLRSIEWMLTKQHVETDSVTVYGDVTVLNTSRLILDSVGKDVLKELVSDYLSLLDTSATVYEKNGDCAIAIFSSAWCQFLDMSSRQNCNTDDNAKALSCGKWLCHETSWKDVSKVAIETGEICDREGLCGLFLYSVPIKTHAGVIGTINLSYGAPPSDDNKLHAIADLYLVDFSELKQKAAQYQTRPLFVIEQAKRKLQTAAVIIGEIVERRQAELELEKLSVRQQAILSSVPDIIMEVDNNKVYTWANQAGFDFFGADVIGREASDYFVREQKTYEIVQPLFNGDEHVIYVESWQRRFDGEERLLAWWCKVLRNEDGIVTGALSSARDITVVKTINEELLKAKQDWETIFQSIPHPTFIMDKNQNVIAANSLVVQALSLSLEQMQGKKCWELMHGDDAHQPPPGCPFSDSCEKDNSVMEEMEVQALDGVYLVSCKPIFDKDGKVDKVIHIAMDITSRKRSEQILAESEEKYRRLIETANEGILAVDVDFNITYVNKRFTDMLGYSETEMIGKPVNSFVPKDEATDHYNKMKERQTGKDDHYERSFLKKDGSIVCTMVSAKAEINEKGEFNGSFGMFTDITSIKLAEQALKDSQARFEQFMNQIPGNVFIKDTQSRFLYVNEYLKRIHNAYDWVGKTPEDIFDPATARDVMEDDKLAISARIKQMVDELPDNDGKTRYYETTKFTIKDAGIDTLIGGLSLDITARKLAEDERNQYAKRLEILHQIDSDILEAKSLESICKAVLEHLRQLIPCDRCSISAWKSTKENWVLFVNDKNNQTQVSSGVMKSNPVGFETDLTSGKSVIIQDISQYSKQLSAPAQRLIQEGLVCFLYMPLIMQGDYYGSMNFGSSRINNFNQEHISLITDIAKQMTIAIQQMHLSDEIAHHTEELETKVEERTEQLKHANKELETFSYTVAHDLRSPLRSIDGFSNILLEDYAPQLDEEAKRKLQVIRTNALKMDTLIKELLGLARLNPYSMKYRSLNMNDIVSGVLEAELSPEVKAAFEINIEQLPAVYADNTLVNQIWQNLITNAVKFTQPSAVKQINIGSFVLDNEVVYFIKDSGVGFDMKYVDKIFGPFQRLHKEFEFEGTGIGLAIVYKIIQRHNGRVWAESEPGKGAAFYFSIPAQT
jgi:PAS domain S-box-containing protein